MNKTPEEYKLINDREQRAHELAKLTLFKETCSELARFFGLDPVTTFNSEFNDMKFYGLHETEKLLTIVPTDYVFGKDPDLDDSVVKSITENRGLHPWTYVPGKDCRLDRAVDKARMTQNTEETKSLMKQGFNPDPRPAAQRRFDANFSSRDPDFDPDPRSEANRRLYDLGHRFETIPLSKEALASQFPGFNPDPRTAAQRRFDANFSGGKPL